MEPTWVRKSRNGTCIVFVHGVLSNQVAAWENTRGVSWPLMLCDEETIDDVAIYLFEYRADMFSGTYSLDDAVDYMREYFRVDDVWSQSQKNLVFVCHSQGGIVVRRFLVRHQAELIQRKINIGLFLIASPSLGSEYANYVSRIAPLYNVQLNALQFSQQNLWLNGLDRDFMNLKESSFLKIFGKELIEDNAIVIKRFLRSSQVVPPFSGAKYFGEPVKIPHSDHISISKPESGAAIQHRLLVAFIQTAIEDVGPANNVEALLGIRSKNPILIDHAISAPTPLRRKVEEERQAVEAHRKAEQERQAVEAHRKAEEERRAVEAHRKAEEERRAVEAHRKAEQERRAVEAHRKAGEERQAVEARRKAEQERRAVEEERRAVEARPKAEEERKNLPKGSMFWATTSHETPMISDGLHCRLVALTRANFNSVVRAARAFGRPIHGFEQSPSGEAWVEVRFLSGRGSHHHGYAPYRRFLCR